MFNALKSSLQEVYLPALLINHLTLLLQFKDMSTFGITMNIMFEYLILLSSI
jgi:hypothetical protein